MSLNKVSTKTGKVHIYFTEIALALRNTALVKTYTDNYMIGFDDLAMGPQTLTIHMLDAERALSKLHTDHFIGDGRMQIFYGTMRQNGSLYQLEPDTNPSLRYDLQWGQFRNSNLLANQYGLKVNDVTSSTRNFRSISNVVNGRVRVEGHLQGNTLFVHQLDEFKRPIAPTNLAARNVTTNSFKVDWNASPLATSYEVSISSGGTSILVNTQTTEAIIQYFPSSPILLNPNTTYTVTVRAVNSSGATTLYSDNSQPITVVTLSPTPTPTPTSNCTTDTVVTDTTWQWQNGGTYVVNDPVFGLAVPGALPIWVSAGQCVQCSYVIYKDYFLPAGWYVRSASALVQASQYADVAVAGRDIGSVTQIDSQSGAKFLNIDPSYFGTGGNSLKFSFLAQNFNLPRPAVVGKFEIDRCQF